MTRVAGTRMALCALLAIAGACAGGRPRAENLTGDANGWRVQGFDVGGPWVVYEAAAANVMTDPTRLVLRHLHSGAEEVLDSAWKGGEFATSGAWVAWWSRRETNPAGAAPLRVRRTGAAGTTAVAEERVRAIDMDGPWLAWEAVTDDETVIRLHNADTGETRDVAAARGRRDHRPTAPRISGARLVWTAYDAEIDQYRLAAYDVANAASDITTLIQREPFRVDLAGDFALYRLGRRHTQTLHLYDLRDNSDRIIARGPRLRGYTALGGGLAAWAEEIAPEDYEPVPGQPLMGPSDFNDIYRYAIGTGEITRLARNLLTVPPRLDVEAGQVYCTVYREPPPPGESNLIVPVDLWRW